MKTPRIVRAVGHIDDDLIAEAQNANEQPKRHPWLKFGSIAACLAVVVIAGAAFLPSLLGNEKNGKTDGRYKAHHIQSAETAILWPWEYLTVSEKYTALTMDGITYRSHGRPISEEILGDLIGTYSVTGYDNIDGRTYTEDFEVYRMKYADKSQFVAVKMDESYYVFKKDAYAPPKTLGELFTLADLPNAVELRRFSQNGDAPSEKHFVLSGDDAIWEILSECKDAPFVEDIAWTVHGRNYYSFTITSETLGVYKVAMYITEDGYLWTNAFDYQYLFHIGEDAAGRIMQYAKEHSTETEYEPYQKSIVGKVTEITDEHILVDDSVLCKNPEDGITYRVLLNDLRISRYIDHGIVKVGSTVQVTYEDEIYHDNTINSAVSVSTAVISDGDVLIPE